MASPQLPNHLRSHRKRLALSQEDVAYLLGSESGAKVCRYECFMREPGLRCVLAYEAIFQKPARDLFPGLYSGIERDVASRATKLLARIEGWTASRHVEHKRKALTGIAALQAKDPS